MASQPIYQLYAELCDYQPKMWRRFQVMNNITMARLGYIVMTLFEMKANHLFCFDVPAFENFKICSEGYLESEANAAAVKMYEEEPENANIHIELLSEDGFSEYDGEVINALDINIRNVLDHEGETMVFTYDYGDSWQVRLTLEAIIRDKELPGKELPRVLAGEGFGIVEDCGGIPGLYDIAKAYREKKGKQYKEFCGWLGVKDLDLSGFDMDDMNFRLKKVPRIYADIYEYDLEPTKQSLEILEREYKK